MKEDREYKEIASLCKIVFKMIMNNNNRNKFNKFKAQKCKIFHNPRSLNQLEIIKKLITVIIKTI